MIKLIKNECLIQNHFLLYYYLPAFCPYALIFICRADKCLSSAQLHFLIARSLRDYNLFLKLKQELCRKYFINVKEMKYYIEIEDETLLFMGVEILLIEFISKKTLLYYNAN